MNPKFLRFAAHTLALTLYLLTYACKRADQDRQSSQKNEPEKTRVSSRIRGERSPREPDSSKHKIDLQIALKKASESRGNFIEKFFSTSPMDSSLAHLKLDDALEIFVSAGIEPRSFDEIALLSRYLEVNRNLNLDRFAKLVRERNIPEFTNRIVRHLATRDPELALDLLNETIANHSLRSIALMNLFNGAASTDIDKATMLASTLKEQHERGLVAIEVVSSYEATQTPFSTLAPLILNNESAFSGSNKILAVQAMANHPVPAVLQEFDTTISWQKTLVVDYLVRRNRSSVQDVEQYLASSKSNESLTESDRKLIEATRRADVRPAEH